MLVDFFPSTDGVFFISSNLIYTAQRFDMMFPSTDGVFFISSMLSATFLTIQSYCFRPLPGAFLFHQNNNVANSIRLFRFRPLPGAFLFHHVNDVRFNYPCRVSVPCRGLFYFIQDGNIMET